MVDRDEEPSPPEAAGGLSADEADRLSERFRPSWEELDESAKAQNRKLAKQTLIGIQPLQPLGNTPKAPEPQQSAPAREEPPPPPPPPPPPVPPMPELTTAPKDLLKAPPKEAVVATSPKEPVKTETTPRKEPVEPVVPKEPDTVAPKEPVASAARIKEELPPPPPPPPPPADSLETAPVTTRSPSEAPRGIVMPYQPKDDPSGPAVVVREDVRAMEEAQAADADRRRELDVSSRRAPTMLNMKAPDLPSYSPAALGKKSNTGWWVLLIGLVLACVVLVVMNLGSSKSEESANAPARVEPPPPEKPPAMEPAALERAALEPPAPVPAASTAAANEPSPAVATPEPSATEGKPALAKGNVKRAPSKPAAPRPVTKPAPAAAPKKGGVIVRDTPF